MVQESLGFDNVWEFCEGPSCQIKIVKRNKSSFFRAISYILAGIDELYVYIRLKVTEFMKRNGTHIQNEQAYLKQSKME